MNKMLSLIPLVAIVFFSSLSYSAEQTIKMDAKNIEIVDLIHQYAKFSKRKFMVDPQVRGRISIFNPEALSIEEGYNQLSSALAVNSYAIVKRDDVFLVKTARNVQRDDIEVTDKVPSLVPERMVTWVYTAKHMAVDDLNRNFRIFPSKDGEMVPSSDGQQIVITDWTSNIHRVAQILEKVDVPNPKK